MLQYRLHSRPHVCKQSFLEIHEVACNKFKNIDGKACSNIPEAVHKLALSARLCHSIKTE